MTDTVMIRVRRETRDALKAIAARLSECHRNGVEIDADASDEANNNPNADLVTLDAVICSLIYFKANTRRRAAESRARKSKKRGSTNGE